MPVMLCCNLPCKYSLGANEAVSDWPKDARVWIVQVCSVLQPRLPARVLAFSQTMLWEARAIQVAAKGRQCRHHIKDLGPLHSS